QFFGLDAARKAVGFRTNRVSQTDDLNAPRDLLVSNFNNWGVETRFLHRYRLLGKNAIFLVGNKWYSSNNSAIQGAGTAAADADFSLANDQFPAYPNQSSFIFPNRNLALFAEHIFYLNDQLSFTPGVRLEHIKTESEGTYRRIDTDLAGNPIRDTSFEDNRSIPRQRILLGLGTSYKPSDNTEWYINVSQNYRSVTFNDIRVINPSFQVDPDIRDESGWTADIGWRGRLKRLNYDLGGFVLQYNDRLGEVLRAERRPNATGSIVETGRVVRFRGNIGNARIYGLETLLDYSLIAPAIETSRPLSLNIFTNVALTHSQYIDSEIAGVTSNQVEFIPLLNLKTGFSLGYDNFKASGQYTYLSRQFTDASNAPQDINDNQSGIVGVIPAYGIMDLSLSYEWRFLRLETGINNVLNESYFTRRATGYPGPGIIPSAPRTAYVTLQLQL
ncbi:MAG: TonB-dependent receptor, partial [Bacteroidota bacterium]